METSNSSMTILLAEADRPDQLLIERAIAQARPGSKLRVVASGTELLEYLYRRGAYANASVAPRPAMILLELKTLSSDAWGALETIKRDPQLRRIPVVVLTTYRRAEDIVRSYDVGANSFITKPLTYQGLVDIMQVFHRYWFELVDLPTEP